MDSTYNGAGDGNNNNNNNNFDYTNSGDASVDNDGVSPSDGDNVRCNRRNRTQPDRLSYSKMGGAAAFPEHLADTCLYLFDKAKCTCKYARD